MRDGYEARCIVGGSLMLVAVAGLLASTSRAGTLSTTTTIDVVIDPTTTTVVSSTSTTSTLSRGKKIDCPDARWELSLDGDQSLDVSALQLGPEKTVTLHSICPAVDGKRRPTKKGTRIKARWKKGICDGLEGKVRVKARTDATCDSIEGKLKAKGFKQTFVGTRVACGDGLVDPSVGETCDPPESDGCDPLCGIRPSGGTTLHGPAAMLAVDAVFDFDVEDGVPEEELSTVDGRGELVRTRLEVEIDEGMTVQAFNDILGLVEGTVVSMLENVPFLLIRIPDPGSLDALAEVEATIAEAPGVLDVARQWVPEPTVLPSNYPITPGEDPTDLSLGFIAHLLAAEAPSAWNARAAMGRKPTLLMFDFFGNAVPNPQYFDVTLHPGDFGVGRAERTLHGYQMLSVITAKWGGPEACKDGIGEQARPFCATGAFPGTLPLRVVDVQQGRTAATLRPIWGALENRLVQRICEILGQCPPALGHIPPNVVVSSTVRTRWALGNRNEAGNSAGRWLAKALAAGIRVNEDFLMVQSAGNVDGTPNPNSPRQAYTNSPFAAAALHPGLIAAGINVRNTVIVENRMALDNPFTFFDHNPMSFLTEDLTPFELAESSPIRGTVRESALSAVGTNVWTLLGASSGTSQATALTAGIAAYLWSLRPSLTATELRDLLVETGALIERRGRAPALDAMAAVLALDDDTTGPRIRRAIVDYNDDGTFDDADVTAFFDARTASGSQPGRVPRFGRGDVLGTRASRPIDLDLDGEASNSLSAVEVTVFGQTASLRETVQHSERFFCYYVLTDLFAGTDTGRRTCCEWFKEAGVPSWEDINCDCSSEGGGNRVVACPPPPPENDLQGLWTIRSPGGDELQLFYLLNNGIVTEPSGLAWKTVGSWTRVGDRIGITPCAPRNPDFGTQPSRWFFEGVAGSGLFGACEGDLDVPCASDGDCGESAPCIQANSCLGLPCPGLIGHLTRIDAAMDVATSEPTLVRSVQQGSASPAYRELEPGIEECAEWRLKDNATWVTLDCDVTLTNENTGEVLCSGDCWPEWGGRDFPHICGLSFPRSEFTRPPCGLIDGIGLPCEGREETVGGEPFEHIPFCPRGFRCTTMQKPSGQYCACIADAPPPCTGDAECFEGEFCAERAGSADGACIDDCPTCNFFP